MKLNEFYFQWNQRLTECLIEIEASDRGRTYIHWLEQFSQQKYKNGSFYLIAFRNFICHEATIKTDGWIAANQCLSFDLDRDKYDQKTFENLLEISYQDYLKLEPDVLFIYLNLVTDF